MDCDWEQAFGKENLYGDPRTGFFSFQHKLPQYQETLKAHQHSRITPGPSGLDQVLQHMDRCIKGYARGEKSNVCGVIGHSRQHCYGHGFIMILFLGLNKANRSIIISRLLS